MILSGQSYRDYSSSDQHNGRAGVRVGVGVEWGGESGGKWRWGWEHGECTLATSKHLRILREHHGRARAGRKGSQAEVRGFTQKRVGI